MKFVQAKRFSLLLVLIAIVAFTHPLFAQNTDNSLPENISANPQGCNGCQVDEVFVCDHTPVTNVPKSYDVDNDKVIGLGDELLVQRFIDTFGEDNANGRREDANGDGRIDAKDLADLQAFFSIVTGNGGILPDVCGICGGFGDSCNDCAGVPKGDKVFDACGVCGGTGPGECGCDLTKKKDCAGDCNGTKVKDECGVCDGDNSTCLDCAGVPNGTSQPDECGVCDGPGITSCDEQCFSTKVNDACGVCDGSGPGECGCDLSKKKDCAGECGGTKVEDCAGICGGTAKVDCNGICGGDAVRDCAGVCNGTAKPDCAGICNGTTPVDCAGTCGGTKVPDCSGTCGGTKILDCAGTCGGAAVRDCAGICNGNTPVDCAGTCRGTKTVDCAGACGGSAVTDDCGVCGGDGSSCNVCSEFGIRVQRQDLLPGFSEKNWTEIRALGQSTPAGRCLNQKLDEAIGNCMRGDYLHGQLDLRDDCVVGRLLRGTEGGQGAIVCQDAMRRTINPDANNRCPADGNWFPISVDPVITQGYVFFDADCKQVFPASLEPVIDCVNATLWYRASPISLILDGEEFSAESTLASFSLDPVSCPGCVFEWKASEKAPLLVYDPEHTGKITSASQLFGNWTFGGKRLASLLSSSKENSQWRDGYEALGSMDSNNDGVVSGTELQHLALWFDKNKDGISDAGEVKPISEVGIKSLAYKGGVKDAKTGDIVLSAGYEREVNGKTIKGTSVDWYADGAPTAQELIGNKMLDSTFGRLETSVEAPQAEPEVSDASKADSSVAGVWQWKSIIGAKDQVVSGTLIMSQKDGKLSGYSLAESGFNEAKVASSVVAINHFNGQVKPDGSYGFTIVTNNGELRSTFKLAKNGELEGQTWVSKSKSKNENSITYKWVATKR